MEIYVCIGSSCHLKGSYNIINAFKELIAEYKLTIKVNDEIVTGLNTDNAREIFIDKVVKELQPQ